MLTLYEEFLRELQFGLLYSEHTIIAYKGDLAYYEEFQKKKLPLRQFSFFLTKKNLSPRSQARIISSIRSYLKFLQRHGKTKLQIKDLKHPKVHKKLPRPVVMEEFLKLWKSCEETCPLQTLKNQLLLSFLYGLGCRVSELCSINIEDFNETESWINLKGKGNRQRLVPLTNDLHALLVTYLTKVWPKLPKKDPKALFVNKKGNRPSRVDVWRWLKTWSFKAGFKEVKAPHSFRHGCATGLLDQGADLRSIQKLLGHLSIQTTQIYTSVSSKNLSSAIKTYHPLSKLKKVDGF